jgi:hypothetical protein
MPRCQHFTEFHPVDLSPQEVEHRGPCGGAGPSRNRVNHLDKGRPVQVGGREALHEGGVEQPGTPVTGEEPDVGQLGSGRLQGNLETPSALGDDVSGPVEM